jgi:hypothetical protein
MAYSMPLKLKYRSSGKVLHRGWDPPEGTRVYTAGRFKSKSANQGASKKVKGQTLRPRRKIGLGAVA